MARTYYPGAVAFASVTHKYLTRYQAKLMTGKSAGQIAAIVALINCLADFLLAWPKDPISP